MLALSRRENESIVIAGRIKVTIVKIRRSRVRLGIEAPKDVSVLRSELMGGEGRSLDLGPCEIHHGSSNIRHGRIVNTP